MERRLRLLLLFFACLFFHMVHAQQQEVDERALIEVKDGISISKDTLFLLNLRFRMQNRFGLNSVSRDDLSVRSVDARVRRLRLRLDGHVLSGNIRYYIQLNFSRADLELAEQGTIAHPVRDAMVYYHFDEHFYVGFGQSKLPGTRQRVISSGNLQFPDRSIANGLYTLDRDFGIFAYWTIPAGPQQFQVKGALSTGDGRGALPNNEGMAYTGRMEWLPFGPFTRSGDYSEGDLEFEQRPKISFGASYSFNDRAVRTQGQLGNDLFADRDMTTFIGDMIFKYRGWSFLGEYFDRQADDPITMNEEGDIRFIPTGIGISAQGGRLFRSGYEIVGRYTIVDPGDDISSLMRRTEEALLGGGKYLNGHRIKLQLYTGYRWFNASLDDPRSFWTTMFQVEFGI
jgi:phosphate-selective porin OprO and OprP